MLGATILKTIHYNGGHPHMPASCDKPEQILASERFMPQLAAQYEARYHALIRRLEAIFPTVFSERTLKQMSALELRLSSGRNACLFIVSLNPYARKLRINSDCDFFRALKRCLEKGLTLRAYCCRYSLETGIIIDKSIPIMIEE